MVKQQLTGTDRVRRKDSLPKSTGKQVYIQDIRLPDMFVAMVAHSPRFGGTLALFDDADARKLKGVVDVFAIETDVTVVAEITFAARRGRAQARLYTTGRGICRRRPSSTAFLAEMRAVWDTHVFGVLAVCQAMVPMLREKPNRSIVAFSSSLES